MRFSIPIAVPASVLILMALFLIYVSCESSQESETSQESSEAKPYANPPAMTIDTTKDFFAVFEMENGGRFTIDLYEKLAPITVNNFVFLARESYYDGVTFHRVIEGFMAQGGDPTGTGTGGPGYSFDNELTPKRRHAGFGVLSMANAGIQGGKGTNGSQFFITFTETKSLLELNIFLPMLALRLVEMFFHHQQLQFLLSSCHVLFG